MDANQFGDAVDAAVIAASNRGHAVSIRVAAAMLEVADLNTADGQTDSFGGVSMAVEAAANLQHDVSADLAAAMIQAARETIAG
jgi:hypothetical protein